MYKFKSKVRYSECDENLNITTSALVNYMQDCVSFQSDEVGNGPTLGKTINVGWVLSSWHIRINRYPKLGEEITVCTWPYKFRGFFGYRNFVIYDSNGEVIVCADSLFLYVDVKNNSLLRIPKEVQELYETHPPYEMEKKMSKISIPDELQAKEPVKIPKFFIDSNNHVNNEKYILMAMDYLPKNMMIKTMRVEYVKAAKLGDVIYPFVSTNEEDAVTVLLKDAEGSSYTNLKFEANI